MILRLLLLVALCAPLLAQPGTDPASPADGFRRLLGSTSVRWQSWDPRVAERSAIAGKPVYLFIGSGLSELTRATLRDTFARKETAVWLNESFTCVAVDADEQPAVAALARHYLASVKQLAGLPMHLWLTPELEPYEGYTYLPPSEEWGKPGYLKSARGALDAWQPDPARARALAGEAREFMRLAPIAGEIDPGSRLRQAAEDWLKQRDPVHGGFGTAPKQPEPELIRFLLRRGAEARQTALAAARALADGALRDSVDGGFFRRVLDEAWREPYYQKTLVDQARITLALLEVAAATGEESLRAPAFGALDFALSALRLPDGTYAAALDGTLDDPPLPPERPRFALSGKASLGATAHLLDALQAAVAAGEARFTPPAAEVRQTLRHVASGDAGALRRLTGSASDPDPADLLALAAALREGPEDGDRALSRAVLRGAIDRHLDRVSGLILASPEPPPPARAVRAPASGATPSAAALALASGLGGAEATLVRRALLQGIVYDTLPPGEVLWALGLER